MLKDTSEEPGPSACKKDVCGNYLTIEHNLYKSNISSNENMDMEENEFHQRQPLLASDPDDILLENGLSSLTDNSPRIR